MASFQGNRHLRVRYAGEMPADAAPSMEKIEIRPPTGMVCRLIGVSPEAEQIPIAVGDRGYGTIVIETDPYNETLEVWNEFAESLATLTVFGGLTICSFIFLSAAPCGRSTGWPRRWRKSATAITKSGWRPVGAGAGAVADSFNRMAARLAETPRERRLNERVTLQQEERGELARDLHDEVSRTCSRSTPTRPLPPG